MKKMLLALGAYSLAIAPAMMPTAAGAQADNSANRLVGLCKAVVDEFPGLYKSVGECVSLPAKICDSVKKSDGFPLDLGDGTILKNQGECVNYVKANIS